MSTIQSNQRAIEGDFWVGECFIQPRTSHITRNGKSHKVEPKVMEVLVWLAEQVGETVTRGQLLETLWADTFVTEDALNRSISKRPTTNPARDHNQVWSPDGRTIAFVRTLENERAIYAIPALGGAERKLASCPARG